MRIAVAGLQHETNSFAPGLTGAGAFAAPGGWPRLSRGAEMLERLPGTSVPMAGALAALEAAGATPVPLLWAMALPSGPVEHAAFCMFRDEMLRGIAAAGPLDGVLIELHGAMVTTAEADAEGAVLEALRAAVGPEVPLVATLDMHANLSPRMVAAADLLEVYRTYPHIDMAETGARAAAWVLRLAQGAPRPAKAYRAVPYLMPLIAQATTAPAMARLCASARAEEDTGAAQAVTLTTGFPYADTAECGPAIAVYAAAPEAAEAVAERQLALWIAAEGDLESPLLPPADAVAEALAVPPGPGPVILADVQDNPGGGGTQDTTGLLQALLTGGARGAVLVHLCDPAAAQAAHEAGVGAVLDQSLGAARSPQHGPPVPGPWRVVALGSGSFTGQGPMYRGNAIALGPVALLERDGVGCIVAPNRMQASEPGLLHHLGLDPAEVPVLALKSSVHFRGAFQDMARAILHVAAPGDLPMDLTSLPYQHAVRLVAGQPTRPLPKPTGEIT